MPNAQEIERTWLTKRENIPLNINLDLVPSEFIAQGYIVPANYAECSKHLVNITFRLRRKGAAYYFTRKFGGTLIRFENELQLTEEQFTLMWSMVGNQYLHKTRYCIPSDSPYSPCGNKTWCDVEIDIFEGKLDGLTLVEIEFPSEEDAKSFVAPDWFGVDVTEEFKYSNFSLAVNGLPDAQR